jgi:NADPH:quinone reductase-like Zn-dependent oxidoreductase
MRAVQIREFGKPTDVLELVDLPEPAAPLGSRALVQVEYAPINVNDLLMIKGTFHYTPALPTVVGNEGVGRVLEVGPDVLGLSVGDRVLLPVYCNSWRERLVVNAEDLVRLPGEADVQQLAMLRINPPAAALMLSEYVTLKPGDWIVQNAANSGVGRAVIAFANARGVRVISLVRRQEVIPEIKTLGSEVVLLDDGAAPEKIKEAIGHGTIKLALDGVSGSATARLASLLSSQGHLVGYAFSEDYAAPGDLRTLMESEVSLHSFYQVRPEYEAKIPGILAEATAMIASGKLYAPVAQTYPLSAIKEAVAHAERGGKVLLDAQA